MNLYRWRSNVLKRYRSGDIIVMAESVDEARDKVKAEYDPLADNDATQDHYLTTLSGCEDADSREELDESLSKLQAMLDQDLEAEPEVIDSGVVFVAGSE